MLTLFDLSGEVALVTGGNSGIGRAMAGALAAAGAAVVLAARDEKRLAEAAGAIVAAGGRASAVRCDVRKRDDIERAVDTALTAYGKLSVIANNAGVSRGGPPERYSEAD